MKTTGFRFALFLCVIVAAPLSAAPVIETATFQNGVAGYAGTFDRRISPDTADEVDGSTIDTEVTSYFIDGGGSALNDEGVQQGLIRFDEIVGAGAVPAGAKVISATIDIVTGSTSNAQSGGAYNVYRLTTPFDSSSTWAGTFGGDGLAGDVAEILGSFDDLTQGTPTSARVEKAVQQWVDGASNLGFGIRSDRTTDGWAPHTTGAATATLHPQLTVNYTVDPLVSIDSYQNGVNGYAGTTDIRLNESDGGTVVGSTVDQTFIDGFSAEGTGSPDQPYFVRFEGLNLNYGETFKGELVLKGGFASSAADSGGPFTVHQLLRDWTTDLMYAELGSDGTPTLNDANELIANGTIGPAAASTGGHDDTEVIYIDVTSIVENWRSGQPNYGFYVGTTETSNGWQIFTSGADDPSFRPELRIIGVVPEPAAGLMLVAGVLLMVGRLRERR